MSDLMIDMDEMCEELQCTDVTVRQWIAQGLIPAIQPGKPYRVPRQAFYEAVNQLAKDEAGRRRAAAQSMLRKMGEAEELPSPATAPRRRGPPQSAAGWWMKGGSMPGK